MLFFGIWRRSLILFRSVPDLRGPVDPTPGFDLELLRGRGRVPNLVGDHHRGHFCPEGNSHPLLQHVTNHHVTACEVPDFFNEHPTRLVGVHPFGIAGSPIRWQLPWWTSYFACLRDSTWSSMTPLSSMRRPFIVAKLRTTSFDLHWQTATRFHIVIREADTDVFLSTLEFVLRRQGHPGGDLSH